MTQRADPDLVDVLVDRGASMRIGRKLGRTLYLVRSNEWEDHLVVGIVDSAELAVEICRRWNAVAASMARHPAGKRR